MGESSGRALAKPESALAGLSNDYASMKMRIVMNIPIHAASRSSPVPSGARHSWSLCDRAVLACTSPPEMRARP